MLARKSHLCSLVLLLACAAALGASAELPCYFSSTTLALPPVSLSWPAMPDAAAYVVSIEPDALSSVQLLMTPGAAATRRFTVAAPMLELDDLLVTDAGIAVPWSDEDLWPAALYRYTVLSVDGQGGRAEAASGQFLKGMVERYGPAVPASHPPLLFVHGFQSTSRMAWLEPTITFNPDVLLGAIEGAWNGAAAAATAAGEPWLRLRGVARSSTGRMLALALPDQAQGWLAAMGLVEAGSALLYYSQTAGPDGRECWTVDYPNMDSLTHGARVMRGALQIIRERGSFPGHDSPRVDVICASMGALVTRYYAEQMEPKAEDVSVDRIVFLAGPHRGAQMAIYQKLMYDQMLHSPSPPALEELAPERLDQVLPQPAVWSDRWMAVVGYGLSLPLADTDLDAPSWLRMLVDSYNQRIEEFNRHLAPYGITLRAIKLGLALPSWMEPLIEQYNRLIGLVNRLYYGIDDDGDGMVACASAELGNGHDVYVRRYHSMVGMADWGNPAPGEDTAMVEAVKAFLK